MKGAVRGFVAALMLVLVLAFLGVLGAVTVLAVVTSLVVAFKAGGGWAVGASVVLGFAVVAAGLFERRRRQRRRDQIGVPISTREQPLFWVEIYRVAEGLGTRAPDELRLFADVTAAASEGRSWLGLRPGARSLHLGLPLLTGLTERELRAVVAHAFARSWGPLSFARVLQRGREVIGRIADLLGETSVVARVVGRYGRAYVAVSTPFITAHELATDRLCADLAGNDATTAAWGEVDVLTRGWAGFVDGYAKPAAAVGALPLDIFAGFTSFLQEPGRRTQLADHAALSAQQPLSRYSSVLTLGERLAAIAALPDDDIHDKSGPALGLMRHPDHVIRRVEESMLAKSGSVRSTWDDIVPDAARAAARHDALELARLGHEGGLGPTLSVAGLLELMGFGLVDEMVRPRLAGGPLPKVERQLVSRLVTGFFATAAIESGTASYRFSWAAPRQLVDDLGAVDDLPSLVDSALGEGHDLSALKLWLTAHRVDPELELGPEMVPADLQRPAVGPGDGLRDNPGDGPGDAGGARVAEDTVEGPRPVMVAKSGTASK